MRPRVPGAGVCQAAGHDRHPERRPDPRHGARAHRAGRRRRRRRPGQPAAEPLRRPGVRRDRGGLRRAGPAHRPGRPRAGPGGAGRGARQGRLRRRRRHGVPRHRRGPRARRARRRPVAAAAAGDAHVRGPPGAHRLRRARVDPHRRVRAGPGLRRAAGRRAGVVRAGRDRRRADPVDGRAAAAGRAGRVRAGQGAGVHRRALPGRRPRAVGRGQPGAARRGLRRGRPRLRPPGRGRPDRRARGHEAAGHHRRPAGRAGRGRPRARRLRCALRHRRPARRGLLLPRRRTGEGHVLGQVSVGPGGGSGTPRAGRLDGSTPPLAGRQGRGFLPDSSPNVPVPGAPTSREASAQAAAADGHPGQPGLGDVASATVRTTITVPDSVSMVALLGSGDELLRLVEDEVDADVHVRGNEIAVTGLPADNAFAVRVFDELIALLGTGQTLRPDAVRRVIAMLRSGGSERPADVLSLDIISRRGRTIRPKTLNQKRYVDAIDAHTIVFGIGPAGTGKTYLAMAKAVQALQTKQVNRIILTRPAVEAGERLGYLPGTLYEKIDPYLRPLYDALHDMIDPETIPRLMAAGTIEVAPLAYMRGRAMPLRTPVLTPDGWRPIGDLRLGDLVVGSDGLPTPVLGVYPQGRKQVYRLTTQDGASTLACGEHLWFVRTRGDR